MKYALLKDEDEKMFLHMMHVCNNDGIPCTLCPVADKCKQWWDGIEYISRPEAVLRFQILQRSKRLKTYYPK